MTTEDIKAMLNQVRKAEWAYRKAKDKANAYKQILMGGKSIRFDSDGSTHERQSNPVEDAYIALNDYEEKADRLYQELIPLRLSLDKMCRIIPHEKWRKVIWGRYARCLEWDDIAFEMKCTERHVKRLHGYALKFLADTLLTMSPFRVKIDIMKK